MKKIFKIIILTVILILSFIIARYYIVKAHTNEEIIELNSKQEVFVESSNEEQVKIETSEIQEFDIDSIIIKNEKYTTEHETASGEKYTIIGSLEIPKINIKYDILSSTSVELLKISLNRYWGAQPNELGNMCIVGHNYLDSRFFGNLHTLNIGDCIKITDSYGETLDYYIYDMFIADPYDTRCTSQLTNGETEITLITCYNKGTQRLVVKARAEKKEKINIINEVLDILFKDKK